MKVERRAPHKWYFHEREIWWTNLGTNVGFEEDGKNMQHERPVIVLKKFNKDLFWALPLTSKEKSNKYYFGFKYIENKKEKKGIAILSQVRAMSSKRLLRKIGVVQRGEFEKTRNKVKALL